MSETTPTDDYDFGFSFTDSETVAATTEATQQVATSNSELLALQEKITALMDSQEQLIQGALVQALEDKYKAKLKEVETLILPLLVNLKKNPDKAYIHWPNRVGVIDNQIAKITAVTRS
jgi:hypothetical protein